MIVRILLLFSITLLVSCHDLEPATEEEIQSAINNVKFDKTLIADIHRYDELKNFLQQYSDTIISYKNNKNYVIETDSTGKTDSTLKKKECYEFYYPKDLNDLPAFLQSQFDSIYAKFDQSNILWFEICADRQITILVKEDNSSYPLYFTHMLIWNNNNRGDKWDEKYKDTTINENCVYRIGLWEYHGR